MASAKKGAAKKGAAAKRATKGAVRAQLAEYRRKRDFAKTAEPSGDEAGRRSEAGGRSARSHLRAPISDPVFVIQKHAASHLHFDFRLEIGGTMKSWAVPKGPSLDPAVKRLAMQVEDHPVSYNTFEGTIPAGQYGGGTVMLWDRGTFEPTDGGGDASLRRGHESGRLDFVLHGERLHGAWSLVRTRGHGGGKPQWLLMKRTDDAARPGSDVVEEETTSVASGRTMEEIGGSGKREAGSGKRAPSTRRGAPPTSKSTARPTKRVTVSPPSASVRASRLPLPAYPFFEFTNLEKIFFPDDGYTKGDLLSYYAGMAKYVLPVIADRPLVLRRFPSGIAGKAFYQHNVPDAPAGVRTAPIDVDGDGDVAHHLVGGDLATLLYSIQLGAVSVDPFHARVGSLDTPDYTIIDLDPGPKAPFARVVDVARRVKAELDSLGLLGTLKTSGATGLHVYLPLPPGTSGEAALLLAQIVATRVTAAMPKEATVERAVKARPASSVYVDYLQNILGKTVAGAYAVRARPGATVSTPLEWEELDDALDPAAFTIESVPARVAKVGDLWRAAMRRRNTARALRELATAAATRK
ncbi:MAG TPA: DNA polymerase ligase N-terminal domain-containing protein [Gemmatimonadaceae bacterium]|nr:DNA polymerase ligase N-terminal domain-containing protein [Gemmatimonadaceae bacterium]